MSRHNQIIAKFQNEIVAKKVQDQKDALARQIEADQKPQRNRRRSTRTPQEYLAYEDLPAPSPEERHRFLERLDTLVGNIEADEIQEKAQAKQAYFDWLMQFADDYP